MSMSLDQESSVQALRAEAETNRARLTGTVDELRTQVAGTATDLKDRLSPSAIKSEVTDYVRESRDQLWHSLERKARDNPLQAFAVGAALAYPAVQLLRAMPAPLLLVGAGLLLSRATGNEQSALSEASSAVKERAGTAADSAVGAMNEATDAARRKVHDAQDYVREGVGSAMERAAAATSSISDRVTEAADDAKSTVTEAGERVVAQGEALAQQARSAVSNTWDQNPLLVAGVGLAIGAFIAAAFPSTQAEETVFGDASGALRQQAEGIAAKGVDVAKTAVEAAAGAASEQGLSADGLTSLGESLTEKVRAVAERGVEAALG